MTPAQKFRFRVQTAVAKALVDGIQSEDILASLLMFVQGIRDAERVDQQLRNSGDAIRREVEMCRQITGIR